VEKSGSPFESLQVNVGRQHDTSIRRLVVLPRYVLGESGSHDVRPIDSSAVVAISTELAPIDTNLGRPPRHPVLASSEGWTRSVGERRALTSRAGRDERALVVERSAEHEPVRVRVQSRCGTTEWQQHRPTGGRLRHPRPLLPALPRVRRSRPGSGHPVRRPR